MPTYEECHKVESQREEFRNQLMEEINMRVNCLRGLGYNVKFEDINIGEIKFDSDSKVCYFD